MSARRPYWLSTFGHLGVLALLLGMSAVQRPSFVVGGVRILMPPAGSGSGTSQAPRPAGTQLPPHAKTAAVPAPPLEEKKRPQPELNVVKEADPQGLLPPRKGDIPSTRPRERDTSPPPAAHAERAGAALPAASTGDASGGGIGIEAGVLGANAPWYLVQLRDKIAANWRPPAAIGRAGEARASFHFQVHTEGEVTGVESVQSSSDWQYDIAAKRAILESQPLPPLPADLGATSIGITLIFTQVY